jgi:drug/metabolite transporter (DMT)-like permease
MECVLIEGMLLSRLDKRRKSPGPVAALLLLCVLWSLGSLRGDLLPSLGSDSGVGSLFQRQALPFALLAVVAVGVALARRQVWPRGRALGISSLIGLSLFVAPTVMLYLAGTRVSDLTRVALFSIAPVFAIIFEPYLGSPSETNSKCALAAALVAVVGTFFVFPMDLPQSVAGALAFCGVLLAAACVAAANCWAVRVSRELPGESPAPFAAITAAIAAVGLAVAASIAKEPIPSLHLLIPQLAWSAAVELPGLLLLFWLMRCMSGARMTTRFLIAPLIANLIGLMFLRPAVNLSDGLGLLLITLGAGWLLLGREVETDENGSALRLNAE